MWASGVLVALMLAAGCVDKGPGPQPKKIEPSFVPQHLLRAEPSGIDRLDVELGGAVVYPSQYPRTCERLIGRGLRVAPIDCSELAKAEGAVTCCSLIFEVA